MNAQATAVSSTRKLDFLLAPLPALEGQGLDASDPRFIEIADLVQRGQLGALGEKVEALLDEGHYDIRLLGFYFASRFAARGTSELESIFAALAAVLTQSWESLGPKRKLELHVDKSVTWLCNQILDAIEYHQGKRSATWSSWLGATQAESAGRAITAVDQIYKRLQGPSFTASEQAMNRMLRALRDLFATLSVQQEPAPMAESNPSSAADAQPTEPRSDEPAPTAGHVMRLQVSAQFVELDRKIKAFSQLVASGSYERAALVSDDLGELIEHFDPRRYFPEFFATYSRLMSEHVQDLEAHWEKRETVQWRTLKQFYQVDLEAFANPKRE